MLSPATTDMWSIFGGSLARLNTWSRNPSCTHNRHAKCTHRGETSQKNVNTIVTSTQTSSFLQALFTYTLRNPQIHQADSEHRNIGIYNVYYKLSQTSFLAPVQQQAFWAKDWGCGKAETYSPQVTESAIYSPFF